MAYDEVTAHAIHDVARLEQRIASLEAALRPFVDCNFTYFSGKVLGSDARLTREDVERARAALAPTPKEHPPMPHSRDGGQAGACGSPECSRGCKNPMDCARPLGVTPSQAPSSDRATCPAHGGDYLWTHDCPECVKDARVRGMSIDAYYSRVRPTLRTLGVKGDQRG